MYYSPRRPVKSFQDLEVYQKLEAIAVMTTKRLTVEIAKSDDERTKILAAKTCDCLLEMPILLASAHSLRFGDSQKAILSLENIMLNCNLAVVYLEQFRDLGNKNIEPEFFEEQIKGLLTTRTKLLHLQMSWKKFMKEV